jgi:hypothetical protein
MATVDHGAQAAAQEHSVFFYAHDEELVERVAGYAHAGLDRGAVVMLLATSAHLSALELCLADLGVDAAAARADGRLITMEAEEALSAVLLGGRPDAARFDAVLAELVRAATATGRPIAAYGELVDLLWTDGRVNEAIELETLWNELRGEVDFELLCGYRSPAAEDLDLEAVEMICRLHGGINGLANGRPAGDLLSAAGTEERAREATVRQFPAALTAPRDARRFVIDVLAGEPSPMIEDAMVVISELATNAVVHARSPFTVTVTRLPDGVRFSVRDDKAVDGSGRPQVSKPHGLGIVSALARDWGIDGDVNGKVVWAELPH